MIIRPKFLEARKKGIGASDVSAIMGINPYQTPLDVWWSKRTPVQEEDLANLDNPRAKAGIKLESVIREWYSEETGYQVTEMDPDKDGIPMHPEHKILMANPDGKVWDHEDKTLGGLECKNTNPMTFKRDWLETGVPPYYWTQAQHQMFVMDWEWVDFAVLIGGWDFQTWKQEPSLRVWRDEEWLEYCIPKLLDWWQRHIVEGHEPPVKTNGDAKKRWPISKPDSIKANQDLVESWQALHHVKAEIKQLYAEQDSHEVFIKSALQDNEGLEHEGELLVTWKTGKRQEFLKEKELKSWLHLPVDQQIAHLKELKKSGSKTTLADLYIESKSLRRFLMKKPKRLLGLLAWKSPDLHENAGEDHDSEK